MPINFNVDARVHIDVHLHGVEDSRLLDQIARGVTGIAGAVTQLHGKVNTMDQDVQDNVAAAGAIKAAIDQFPGIINAFEARITALVKQSPTMTDVDRKALQQATADMKASVATALTAIADAADGTDEADVPDTGGGTGTGGTGGTDPGTGGGGTDTGTGSTGTDTGAGSTDPTAGGDGTTGTGGDPAGANLRQP